MSSVVLNDENRVVLGQSGKRQRTGRSSILRQTENLPINRTQRRDPITTKILSTTKSSKVTSTDECTKAPESFNLDKSNSLFKGMTEEPVGKKQVFANDFEGQLDYLEQFGSSSFKESALRKQSLYLNFDPLLRDSPKKSSGPAVQPQVPRPAALVSRLETHMAHKEMSDSQKNDFKLLDVDMVTSAAVPQMTNAEDAIIEVLKYTQKDMDAAIAIVQAKAAEKERNLADEVQKLRNIIAEDELIIEKTMADLERETEKMEKALMELDQASREMSPIARACSIFRKRREKYKSVIEGYRMNEETLKARAQDYLAILKKEEQRYQALEAHTEEKITQANEEIAEVRAKNNAVVAALQAQLRRKQLKVQSLEDSLALKNKDASKLAKLCDKLVTKAEKDRASL